MQTTLNHIGMAALWLGISLLWLPLVWLLMRFITPKSIVERYFKPPHFTSAELILFSHFPGSLMRTGIFMNLCVWPNKGEKRQMTDITKHVPSWYVKVSKLFLIALIIHASSFFVFLLVSYAHILITDFNS